MLRKELIACIALIIVVFAFIASRETTARFKEQAQIIHEPDCLAHVDSQDYILFLRCTKD